MTEYLPAPVAPKASLDWAWDWTDWLVDGDTIASAVLELDTGLTLVGSLSIEAAAGVTAYLLVGASLPAETKLRALCRITTAAGRIDSRTIHMVVKLR